METLEWAWGSENGRGEALEWIEMEAGAYQKKEMGKGSFDFFALSFVERRDPQTSIYEELELKRKDREGDS